MTIQVGVYRLAFQQNAYTNSVGTHAKGYLCPSHGQPEPRKKYNYLFFLSLSLSFLFRYGQLFVLAAGDDDDGDRREWAKVAKKPIGILIPSCCWTYKLWLVYRLSSAAGAPGCDADAK